MTDTLRDLLRESVAEAEMPDVADAAWRAGTRARHRRTLGSVAGVVAVALAAGGTVWAVDRQSSGHGAAPARQPSTQVSSSSPTAPVSPYDPTDAKPDGTYRGTIVWWSPRLAQEATLPTYPDHPLPSTIDVSQVGREISSSMPPVGPGLAAFAVVGDAPDRVWSVGVLGADGVVRLVDTARVQTMRDPEGHLRVRVGPSMLSPTGEYLMFPQQGSVLVLRLRDGHWSTIDTGARPTWDATWADGPGDRIVLWDPERPAASAPVYAVTGGRSAHPGDATDSLDPRWDGDMYGLPRRSPNGSLAQSFTAGLDVPQPPTLHLSPRQSDAIGVASAPDAMLVLPQESVRQKQCCQVAGWLDRDTVVYESRSSEGLRLLAWRMGTGRFWQVSRVVGWTPGADSVVASYADLAP
jgi:hypothetical protein